MTITVGRELHGLLMSAATVSEPKSQGKKVVYVKSIP